MNLSCDLSDNIKKMQQKLRIGESFDVLERIINVHHTTFYLYYLDGFVKDTNLEYVRRDMYNVKLEEFQTISSAKELAEKAISSVEVSIEKDIDKLSMAILSGQTVLLGPNFCDALIIDLRTYVARGTEEPAKEKVLRGSHDGFVETLVCNTALIRRRIRDPYLTFEMHCVGSISRTDVVIGFMSDKVDTKTLSKVKKCIEDLQINALTMGDQSLVEAIHSKSWFNPYPKVRYTERPDVAAAHIIEGKVIVLVDNTPTALILPTSIFDFMQSVDEYYLPVLTGNYLRFIRYLVLLANIFLAPLFILLANNPTLFGGNLQFLLPEAGYSIPIFIQLLILEVSIDGLKLASLNTPDSLGASLSIIGGLILGDYAVKTGWFIPHTILYMAIVTLSGFAQPSIELSYAFKFSRVLMILLCGLWNTTGLIIAVVINFLILAVTKTFTGQSYLYPLIPFNWNALSHLLFRTRLKTKQPVQNK